MTENKSDAKHTDPKKDDPQAPDDGVLPASQAPDHGVLPEFTRKEELVDWPEYAELESGKKFSLKGFEADLLKAVRNGEELDLHVKLRDLLAYQDVRDKFRARFAKLSDGQPSRIQERRGERADKQLDLLWRAVNLEDHERLRHRRRAQKRHDAHLSEDSFEDIQGKAGDIARREERVHEFIAGLKRTALLHEQSMPDAVGVLKSVLSKYDPDQHCGLEMFRVLDITPGNIFPDLQRSQQEEGKEPLTPEQKAAILADAFAKKFPGLTGKPNQEGWREKNRDADEDARRHQEGHNGGHHSRKKHRRRDRHDDGRGGNGGGSGGGRQH